MAATGWHFDNSYTRLPAAFYRRVRPTPVEAPKLLIFNEPLAAQLGLDVQQLAMDGVPLFAGNALPSGADPIAQAYAGHQFGHFNMLGDGRAILLGEHLTPENQRFDIQLKGSGVTPFSRHGDGRAAVGPMLREYIISEAMYGLGVPTTRSLAVVATGEPVYRDTILDGAVLTRVAASHIRVGTFQYAATLGADQVRLLADYTINRHFPDLATTSHPYQELLASVLDRQATLVAQWQKYGFIHGVMNTDNMAIAGETIDYGPCAFMDRYHPETVFSSIDRRGRYAYRNQPAIAEWNLARFAEALLPLFADDRDAAISIAQQRLAEFRTKFEAYHLQCMGAKLGIFAPKPSDQPLVDSLLAWMEQRGHDFTATFRSLAGELEVGHRFMEDELFLAWHERWCARLADQPQDGHASRELMHSHNPVYLARNHLVEQALTAATEHGDLSPLNRLVNALTQPFHDDPGSPDLATPPKAVDESYRTFCGT